jgi:predicted nucleotidyltransferase
MNKNKDPWLSRFENEAIPIIRKMCEPSKIILFSSRVHGTPREDSDIDCVIVSEKFAGTPFVNRPGNIFKIDFPLDVSFFCYTTSEFEIIKEESIVIDDAVKNGIEVDLN